MLTTSQKTLLNKLSSRFKDSTKDMIKEYEKRMNMKEHQDKKQWAEDSIKRFKQNISDIEAFERDYLQPEVKDLGGTI